MKTLIVTMTWPTPGNESTDNLTPDVAVVEPGGIAYRTSITLDPYELRDWRHHTPPSILDMIRSRFETSIIGTRSAYISPASVGVTSNEEGRVTVYEVDITD